MREKLPHVSPGSSVTGPFMGCLLTVSGSLWFMQITCALTQEVSFVVFNGKIMALFTWTWTGMLMLQKSTCEKGSVLSRSTNISSIPNVPFCSNNIKIIKCKNPLWSFGRTKNMFTGDFLICFPRWELLGECLHNDVRGPWPRWHPSLPTGSCQGHCDMWQVHQPATHMQP